MGAMVTHNSVRYRPADAKRAGIADVVPTVSAADVDEPNADETVEADAATKVDEPEVTKVREPDAAKRRGRASDK